MSFSLEPNMSRLDNLTTTLDQALKICPSLTYAHISAKHGQGAIKFILWILYAYKKAKRLNTKTFSLGDSKMSTGNESVAGEYEVCMKKIKSLSNSNDMRHTVFIAWM